MKLQTGIITDKLMETVDFYRNVLEFETKFESDWFILLNVKNRPDNELGIMLPSLSQVRHKER
jgi:catechol 2,3-dioxygenase-like lactoylglutathione lyase family enzyme